MSNHSITVTGAIRLEKWLWAARFYKTRQLAREMIKSGKVHYNGQRVKPSKSIAIGAQVVLRQGNDEKTVIILKAFDQRQNATEAAKLYQEIEESIVKREKLAQARRMDLNAVSHLDRRPTKKERRDLLRFRQKDG